MALLLFAAAYVLFVSIVLKALDWRFAFEQRSTVLTVAILAITNKDVSYILDLWTKKDIIKTYQYENNEMTFMSKGPAEFVHAYAKDSS